MLLDSVTHAKEDVSQRMLIEARTEGEQMIYTAERFVEKNGIFLSVDEISRTRQYIQSLKDVLISGDKDLILKKIDELNEFTRPFAERVMDQAISQAMKGKSI
jgi:molecular chaperone HscA